MRKTKRKGAKSKQSDSTKSSALLQRKEGAGAKENSNIHKLPHGFVCGTDTRGFTRPENRNPAELVLDASEGFIPLWAKDMTLRWRFQDLSFNEFANSTAIKRAVEDLMGKALLAWGDAAPIKFAHRDDAWDFEIVVRDSDRCSPSGCVLASAFFPDAGRHELRIYPKMFEQSEQEQIETMAHEIGHVFGLRHFFAQISETEWASVVFGTHSKFSIMNYGENSKLTDSDKTDLKRLYRMAWSGELKDINGTPIRLVRPFHTIGGAPDALVGLSQVPVQLQPQTRITKELIY